MKKLLFLPMLFLAVRGWALNGYVQGTSSSSASNVTILSAPFGKNVSAGNTIIVGCTYSSIGIKLSSDSVNDTFQYYGSTISTEGRNIQFMYAKNVVGGATTVYCGTAGGATGGDMIIAEYGSSTTAGGFDTSSSSATNAGISTTYTSNNTTTAQANEDMISYCGYLGNGTSISSTSGNLEASIDNNNFEILQDSMVVTAGSYASTGVVNATLTNGFGCIQVAFKGPASSLGTLIIQ